MSYGIFGKLPAKRDFVAIDLPQAVLRPWETWLQEQIAQSRLLLGQQWQPAFLTAPIWRFWCGREVLGQSLMGIMMPSVDGVGRYFPLTILAMAPPGEGIAPPEQESFEDIFTALESEALQALDQGLDFDAFVARVRKLPTPGSAPDIAEANAFISDAGSIGTEALNALQAWRQAEARAASSVWWTQGGDAFRPRLLGVKGLPKGEIFARMLTGAFVAAESGT